MSGIKLGESQPYESLYNPSLLQPIARSLSRSQLPAAKFYGSDIWTAYELSWLNSKGIPQLAVAEFEVPCETPYLVESKSFKYYLNSFNQSEFEDGAQVRELLRADLGAAVGGSVAVNLMGLEEFERRRASRKPLGENIDGLAVTKPEYAPHAIDFEAKALEGGHYIWNSHLLKSNCPVTGQPDWASVWFGVEGASCNPARLLEYVISFREHQDFHEHCVEKMFVELEAALNPDQLWVYARYTRRGGLDINPFRASLPMQLPEVLAPRQ